MAAESTIIAGVNAIVTGAGRGLGTDIYTLRRSIPADRGRDWH